MHSHKTIGDYYAHLLHVHLYDAMQRKLDNTGAFLKAMAGIATVADAQAKGRAPGDAQIQEVKAVIRRLANARYASEQFCALGREQAVAEYIDAVTKELHALNEQWSRHRLFCFDAQGLNELRTQAIELITREHDNARSHFTRQNA
jgi:hypothetical protein